MKTVEQRLAENDNREGFNLDDFEYYQDKLREAVGLAKEFMNAPGPYYHHPNYCRFCGESGEDDTEPDVQEHKPDCKAQKFLEG